METNTKWWYEINGEQKGPVDDNEIIKLIGYGLLKRDNLIWHQGLADWMPLGKTEFATNLHTNANVPTTDKNAGVGLWQKYKVPIIVVGCIILLASMFGKEGTGFSDEDKAKKAVVNYIKARAYNPSSYQSYNWNVTKNEDGSFRVQHTFTITNTRLSESTESITCSVVGGELVGIYIYPDPTLGGL